MPGEAPSDPVTPKVVRPRRGLRVLGYSAATLVGLLLVYLLLGWFAFEPMLRWALPRLASQHGGHQLSFRQASFDPWRLIAQVKGLDLRRPDGEPLLRLEGLDIDLDAASPFKRTWMIERLQLVEPIVHLTLQADGRPNWMDLVDSLAGEPVRADARPSAPPRLKLHRLVVQHGQLALADLSHGREVRVQVDPLDLEVADLSTLPKDRGDHRLTAGLAGGGTLSWRGRLGLNPFAATGELSLEGLALSRLWPYLAPYLAIEPPKGQVSLKLEYELGERDSQLALRLDGVDLRLQGLAVRAAGAAEDSGIKLDRLSLTGGRLDLAKHEILVAAIGIGPGRVALVRDAKGRFDLQDWVRPATAAKPIKVAVKMEPAAAAASAASASLPAVTPPASAPASAATAAVVPSVVAAPVPTWRINLEKVLADGIALQLSDSSRAARLTAQAAQLGFGLSARAEFGAGEPVVLIEQAGLQLDGLKLSSEGLAKQDWFELKGIKVVDGRFSTADHEAVLGAVTLTGGRLRAERNAQGRLPLVDALQAGTPAAETTEAMKATPAATPRLSAGSAAPPWRLRVDQVQALDFALALREASVTPVVELEVVDIEAGVKGLSQDMKRALPVTLDLRVKSGGRFQASGQVVPGKPSADLKFTLEELSLLPLQPYVAQATTLVLKRGVADIRGRLRWQPESWSYDGALDLGPLRVDEVATGERFLSWQRLRAPDLTVTPKGLRIAEVSADGLGSKLTIFKDKTLNVAKVMKAQPGAGNATSAVPEKKAAAADPFDIDIERIRIARGTLDFADLSLALPFGTLIHDLTAQLVGLKTGSDVPAKLELNGKVDEFGLARAAGQIRLFDPTAYTDIKVEFRNVEMANLTPYSATFAGRGIDSGKLTLDLEYKLDKRQLAGENKIVMDRLTLGDRVESPSAANLPLDLAVALLQDSDGRIELGLPVTGSLDDPQFSYGQIVWKAIANVLTKIVTAPFRALGALFGGGEQTLDSIGFDVGRAELLPPEREKLKTLSEAMARRPGLAVTVQAGFDPGADGAALRQLAVRRAVAQASGRAVEPDEDPGPIATTQPASRQALEQLFSKRFGAEALAELRKSMAAAARPPLPASGSASHAQTAPQRAAADLHAQLLTRLLDAEVVDEARLQTLAAERARAIGDELIARKVAAARVRIQPQAKRELSGRTVPTALGLEVAAAPAAASAAKATGAR